MDSRVASTISSQDEKVQSTNRPNNQEQYYHENDESENGLPIQQNTEAEVTAEEHVDPKNDAPQGPLSSTSITPTLPARTQYGLAQQLRDREAELEKAKKEIQKLKAQKDEAVKVWNELANENLQLTTKKNYNHDDNFFVSSWMQIAYDIRNWADQQFVKDPSYLSTRGSFRSNHDLRVLTAYVDSFMGSRKHRPLLIEAYVWKYLVDNVFGGPDSDSGLCWAGNAESDFKRMVAHLAPSEFTST
jgi:hypothetical protein